MFLTAETWTADGRSLGVLLLKPKTFRSGKAGFHGQGKIEIGGKRHQVQVQAVEIGSKKDAGATDVEG